MQDPRDRIHRHLADAPAYAALINSWILTLEAENKSPTTVTNYAGTMEMLVRWLIDEGLSLDPRDADPPLLRAWLAHLVTTRSASTARTRWTGLRNFWEWSAAEGEVEHNPMLEVKPPEVPEKLTKMLTATQLRDLIDSCEGPLLVDRRDQALILLYADTGGRLSEIANAQVPHLDLRERTLLVVGKGRRERVLPFGARTARAVDRYLRVRGRQKYAALPALWLSGKDGRAMTPNAVQQMVRRRGRSIGIEGLHPHMLRHGFADAWLRAGGSEGDLMELAGWRSRQMLSRYAAATRAERAREAYRGRSPMDSL